MNRMIVTLILILSTLILSGCKKNMEYKPQDFFEGDQLKIAKLIFDGNEPLLKQTITTTDREELNRPAKSEMTLLFWAVMNSIYDNTSSERLQIITDLVRPGADPLQPRTKGGSSPAEFVLKGDKGIWIKAMLDGGLSPNARDKTFNEPIIFESIWAKNTETLQVMIKYHADLNIEGALKKTPLIKALSAGKINHINILLENGANPFIKDDFEHTFISLVNRDIDRGDKNSAYIKSLEKIREKIESP